MTCKEGIRDSIYVSGGMAMHVDHSCDMILRSGADMPTPAIFCNRHLPDVLACISREIVTHYTEQCLRKKMSGLSTAASSGPLDSWYKSILADIYKDESSSDAICTNTKSPDSSDRHIPVSFCLEGEIFAPMPQSSFLFIKLTLPPLWQRTREPHFQSVLSVCSPEHCSPGKSAACKPDSRLFKFLYYPDNGLWYASQSGSTKKKLLFSDR